MSSIKSVQQCNIFFPSQLSQTLILSLLGHILYIIYFIKNYFSSILQRGNYKMNNIRQNYSTCPVFTVKKNNNTQFICPSDRRPQFDVRSNLKLSKGRRYSYPTSGLSFLQKEAANEFFFKSLFSRFKYLKNIIENFSVTYKKRYYLSAQSGFDV